MSRDPSPGEKLAASLRRSPFYIDPSLASAVPAAERGRLIARLRRAPVPVYVVLVPMVKGGVWTDDEQLATVVHDRLGRDGVFLGLGDQADTLSAREWGGDHQAREAAWAVNLDRRLDDAPLPVRLNRFADLLLSGTGAQEYKRLSAEINRRWKERERGRAGAEDDGGSGPLLGGGAAGLAVAGVAGLVLWRRRRAAAVRRAESGLRLPRTVFATARRADEDQLREQASAEVIAFGELLEATPTETRDERALALVTRALDAYQAAGKTLDAASGVPDLAGVLVLVDQGRDALASAVSLASGRGEIAPTPLCFFDPLHGDAPDRLDWRPPGTRRELRVRACRDCARAVRARRTPKTLPDTRDGREVPYFEADPERSVWAETGYGQLRDDLVERVLRGAPRGR
ncbi:hypothetical protein [Spirillospora sp. CA-294931]|uniref:hypothetical protein n=1 Tax=Spirillospora sp. CA-294931 TaxID=3240042 RepID=UPI003D92CDBC